MFRLYPCPKCGRADASDGVTFCGTCEREYREDLERERAERAANKPDCGDDCDVPHCRECGQHFVPHAWGHARCEECSL